MCGRAVNPESKRDYQALLHEDFNFFDDRRNSFLLKDLDALPEGYINYNVAPTTRVPVISNNEPKAVQLMPWKYDMKIKGKLIPLFNSKIEQAEKNNAYFGHDLRERRCVVLFKGFYEWIKQDPTNKKTLKQPVFISLKNCPIMPMAGIYKKNENGELGCSIITTSPLESIEKVHNRMPFILNPDSIFDYLSPSLDGDKPYILDWLHKNLIDDDWLTYYPVNQAVGSVKNNQPALLDRCEPIFEV